MFATSWMRHSTGSIMRIRTFIRYPFIGTDREKDCERGWLAASRPAADSRCRSVRQELRRDPNKGSNQSLASRTKQISSSPIFICYFWWKVTKTLVWWSPVALMGYYLITYLIQRLVMSPIVNHVYKQEKLEGWLFKLTLTDSRRVSPHSHPYRRVFGSCCYVWWRPCWSYDHQSVFYQDCSKSSTHCYLGGYLSTSVSFQFTQLYLSFPLFPDS